MHSNHVIGWIRWRLVWARQIKDRSISPEIPDTLWCNLCNSAVAAILVLMWVALILEQMVRGLERCHADIRNVTKQKDYILLCKVATY